MWPEPVERVAAFLRESNAHARLEELPADVDAAPGPAVSVAGFDCDGGALIVLVPVEAAVDRERLARRAGCRHLAPAEGPSFPFQGARVLVDSSLLPLETVWLEAGSPRHVVGLPPAQLLRLTHAETGTFRLES
jgi:prolyl-tRNA editing enzyme YbaK/EbsC (Cys-tRNA(Pro) deacylase)